MADTLESRDSLLEAVAGTPAVHVIPRGTVIEGQYRIERVLGQGGMGVVYLARDLRLDREVAIKVGIGRSAVAISRVAREALALARLSHPNVIVIFQVGEFDGRSYVAMEYVPGGTARAWCHGRSWREIIALYIAAGEGLFAAHTAGLLHRDVKPDNVLVGGDGRPRVADFGLARTQAELGEASAIPATNTDLTMETNARAGTPAYMAPEQANGEDIDARADQFGFCASLWEALFGARPPLQPGKRVVPPHIVEALRRGLRADRDERWPTLAPLLDELRRDPSRRKRSIVVAGAIVVAGLGVVSVALSRTREEDPCGGGDSSIAATWSPARANALRANLTSPKSPTWLHGVATRTADGLDAWSHRWSTEYRAVCQAGRGAWSAGLLDRGVECLSLSRAELDATVDVLSKTPGIASKADHLVSSLGPPERCSNPAYLNATATPPTDPIVALRVSQELASLVKVSVLEAAGETKAAKVVLDAAHARAKEIGDPVLLARTQIHLGRIAMFEVNPKRAAEELVDAYYVARRAKDSTAAAIAASVLSLALLDLSRDPEAYHWARISDLEATLSADPEAELAATGALAAVLKARNEGAQALEVANRALAIAKRLDQDVVETLLTRSSVYALLGQFDAALADLDDGIERTKTRYGAESAAMVDLQRERSIVLLGLHRPDDAVAAAKESVEIATTTAGADSTIYNNALSALGTSLKDAKHYEESLAVSDRTLAFTRAHEEPRSYNIASELNNRADTLAQLHRTAEALTTWNESLSIFEEVLGPTGYEVGIVEANIANTLFEIHEIAKAGPAVEVMLAVMEKNPDSPAYAMALIATGMVAAEKRDWEHANDALAKGLAKIDDNPLWRARARFTLAKVAVARGDRTTARTFAEAARDDARAASHTAYTSEIEKLIATL